MQAPTAHVAYLPPGFLTLSFLLLFFLRNYILSDKIILTPRDLILLFTTFVSLMFLTGSDIVAQFLRKPVPNTPMFIIAIIGAILCTICGITLVSIYQTERNEDAKRVLNIIIIISFSSFSAAVIYVMDGMIIQRFSTIKQFSS